MNLPIYLNPDDPIETMQYLSDRPPRNYQPSQIISKEEWNNLSPPLRYQVDPPCIYIIGSLKNPRIPEIAKILRAHGWSAFDDWYAAGPEADDKWQEYENDRGRTYPEALSGFHAGCVFEFDKWHLDRSRGGVLVLPAGKSGHIELGYLVGQGKPGFILFEKPPERFDVMYRFATVCYSPEELLAALEKQFGDIHPNN